MKLEYQYADGLGQDGGAGETAINLFMGLIATDVCR